MNELDLDRIFPRPNSKRRRVFSLISDGMVVAEWLARVEREGIDKVDVSFITQCYAKDEPQRYERRLIELRAPSVAACHIIEQFLSTTETLLPSITRPAALVRQGSLKLYATSITVRDLKLPGFYQINKLDPDEEGPGFQRLLNQGRAKKLTDYLLDGHTEGDAFLPTSLFLATSKDFHFNPQTNSITFDLSVR